MPNKRNAAGSNAVRNRQVQLAVVIEIARYDAVRTGPGRVVDSFREPAVAIVQEDRDAVVAVADSDIWFSVAIEVPNRDG
ncbi:MAG: hypothetical protein ABSF64_20485 [Bryobacteraceae bacterium]